MKTKIMKHQPELTDEEIRSMMDFDGLIKQHQSQSQKSFKWRTLTLIIGAAVVVSIGSYLLINGEEQQQTAGDQNPPVQKENQPLSQLKVQEDSTTKTEIKQQQEIVSKEKVKTNPATKVKEAQSVVEKEKDVFTEAEPIEGFANLYNYFNSNLKYPSSNLKDSIQGIEVISFMIDENGVAKDYKVVQTLGKAFDEEAIRLIDKMPKWKPATHNSQPVATRVSVPFTFGIGKKK